MGAKRRARMDVPARALPSIRNYEQNACMAFSFTLATKKPDGQRG
jgi:hypothetical protein